MSKRVLRDVLVVSVGELNKDFLYPENVCIESVDERHAPIDIGCIAYLDREHTLKRYNASSRNKEKIRCVNIGSLCIKRRQFLIKLFDHFYCNAYSSNTVITKCRELQRIFNWLDSNKYTDCLDSLESARRAYLAYVDHLNHCISLGESGFSPKKGNNEQRILINLFTINFGESDATKIISGIPIIRFTKSSTDAPTKSEFDEFFNASLHLARGFRELVVENKPFPFLLKMPDYECYVFTSKDAAYSTPYRQEKWAMYNYKEGRVSTEKEYQQKVSRPSNAILMEIERTKKLQDKANANSRCDTRLRYASLSLQAYTQVFMMITAANLSDIHNIEYDEAFEYSRDLFKNDFRNIKLRARGREVRYSLGSINGYKVLQEYLSLRRWILNGSECKYLFFAMEQVGGFTGRVRKLGAHSGHRYYRRIKGKFISSDLPNMTSAKIRKYKSLMLHEMGQNIDVISESLNHTVRTNSKDYSETSPDRQRKELLSFWNSSKKARELVKVKQPVDSGVHITVGHCESKGNPSITLNTEKTPIQPNCKTQFGCLYCEHYSCHADEQDIHKLLSLLYVVEELRRFGNDIKHTEGLFKELTIRIRFILHKIRSISEKTSVLVGDLEKRVFDNGDLTVFWENRLSQYESMGFVV